jgi:hypothetical protein
MVVRAGVRDVVRECKVRKGIVKVSKKKKGYCQCKSYEQLELNVKQRKSRTKEISIFVNIVSWFVAWKIMGCEEGRNVTNLLFFETHMH